MSKIFSPAAKLMIAESARKIFGNLPMVNHRTGYKVLKQKPTGPLAITHFGISAVKALKKSFPGYTTEIEEQAIDRLDRLKRNGKPPPKKGQGKRASRKK